MELLLNLTWFLLTVPALWIGWQKTGRSRPHRRFSTLGSLLILGATLVLLFPIISADDDVRALQAESEESIATPSKRLRQSDDRRDQFADLSAPPALLISAYAPNPDFQALSLVLERSDEVAQNRFPSAHPGRAPPSLLFA